MPFGSKPLTSLSALKVFAGVADDSQNAILIQLIGAASNFITDYCNRDFTYGSYTDIYSGTNTPYLRLKRWPIWSIQNVWLEGGSAGSFGQAPNAFSLPPLVQGVDFALAADQPDGSSLSGLLVKLNGVWPVRRSRTTSNLAGGYDSGFGNVKVQCTANFKEVPGPVALACRMLVKRVMATRQFGALVKSEVTPDYSYSLDSFAPGEELLGLIRPLLGKYRHVPV
jgi:hypothetical protein